MREITTLTLEGRAWIATGKSVATLARGVELAIVLTGWVLVPILPVLAAVITRDWGYVRSYPASLVRVTRHIRATWRGRALSRILVRKLGPAALGQPQRIVGSCTHCGNCCLYRSCVFLSIDEQGHSSCRIYGGRLWKGLTCGEYPIDAYEIDLYSCPSFTALPQTPGSARRVIPVVPADSSSRSKAS